MEHYHRLLRASALCLALFIGVGLTARIAIRLGVLEREVYPFSAWFLFSKVPDGRRFQVVLHRVNGRSLEPPPTYNQADGLVAHPHSIETYYIIQGLGRACQDNDPQAIARQRRLLEAGLPPGTEYQLVEQDGDPIREWKGERSPDRRNLERFTCP